MKFTPHQYQEFAIEFICNHPESMLFLDMGLGKTVISLMAIRRLMKEDHSVSKVLVVAPLRVAATVWPEELKKWDGLEDLRMSVMVGLAKHREAALNTPADIYVINREVLTWLTDYLEKHWMPWPFDMVVIDELSSFKNYHIERWKALRKVRPYIRRIVGLTGTPAANGLEDLWAETLLIDQGERLGRSLRRFRDSYFTPGDMNYRTRVVYNYRPLPGAEEKIFEKLGDISVSMKAKDFLNMPERITVNHTVEMEEDERRHYDQMREEMVTQLEGEEITAANAATLIGKLQQMANGAVYDGNRVTHILHTRKLALLDDLVEAANGQPVLIACWFRHDRERIMDHLVRQYYDPRELKSEEDIRDWNAGKIRVALISPAGAGHGLNIQQGGHILIWFSPVWSLELYQQTNARLWRQGQQEVVTIHHLITKDTVDEDILKALEQKDCTQQRLIDSVKARLAEGGTTEKKGDPEGGLEGDRKALQY